MRAVGHVTIQNRFEAPREDTVLGMNEPHCAATWFDMSTDSDQGAECSAGDHRSVVLGQCEAAPASSKAVFRSRVAEVCIDRAKSATHIRERGIESRKPPFWRRFRCVSNGSKVNGSIGAVNRGTPEDSGLDGVVSSETESLEHPKQVGRRSLIHFQKSSCPICERQDDEVDLPLVFERRAVVMRSIPFFLRGLYQNVMLMALEEICASEALRRARRWKLFLFLPRMLLHRPPRVEPRPSANWKPGVTVSHVGNGQNSWGKHRRF